MPRCGKSPNCGKDFHRAFPFDGCTATKVPCESTAQARCSSAGGGVNIKPDVACSQRIFPVSGWIPTSAFEVPGGLGSCGAKTKAFSLTASPLICQLFGVKNVSCIFRVVGLKRNN